MAKRWVRIEKRLEKRYNIPMRAILSFTGAPTQDLKTLNISSCGAFILTNQAKPEGTEVLMSLLMDGTTDRKLVEGDASNSKGTEVFMSQFMEAIPCKTVGARTAIKLKGVVKRSYNCGMAIRFDNQYCIDRI